MIYLQEQSIIHRDVAARNMLTTIIEGKYFVKVSDFGLSRLVQDDTYYSQDKNVPIKWCAPEVLEKGRYSHQSDVWAFGIVLWVK